MGEQAQGGARAPAAEDGTSRDGLSRSHGIGRYIGRITKRRDSTDGGAGVSGIKKPNGSAQYDPFRRGLAFGRKELDRLERERKDIPGVSRAIDLGGAGLGYDAYGRKVLSADDPFAALNEDDRATYGPPPTDSTEA